jgi:hypothetical protein
MRHTRILVGALAGLLLIASASAQTPQKSATHKHTMTQKQQTMAGDNMMEQCKAMMEARQKMQAEMKAMDTELDKLVAEMNAAPPDKKVDATAAALTTMAEQRKMMREKMEAMHMSMMQHMMAHMQMGKASMAECPMMKGMMDKKEPQGGTKKPNND